MAQSLSVILFELKSLSLIRPERIRRRLDFPVPLGPTMARICEALATNETDLSTFRELEFLPRQKNEDGVEVFWCIV